MLILLKSTGPRYTHECFVEEESLKNLQKTKNFILDWEYPRAFDTLPFPQQYNS